MLLLADFLSSASRPDLQVQLQAAPPLPPQLQHCLISGPPRSGKTSILFHLAYRMACQQRSVLLLCLRAKLELTPLLLPDGVAHTDPAWERVAIRYLESGEELLRYAASIHLLDHPPDVLLIDDLHTLGDLPPPSDPHRPRSRDMALCRLLALLHDTVGYLDQRTGRRCLLVATELGGGEGPRSLYLTQRWLPLVLSCRPVGQFFRLAVAAPPGGSFPSVDYSLRQQALQVDAVHPPTPTASARVREGPAT